MTDKQLAEYGHLWGAAKNDYILFNTAPDGTDLSRCFILDRVNKVIVLIENRELVLEVMQRMVDAGVKVSGKLPGD